MRATGGDQQVGSRAHRRSWHDRCTTEPDPTRETTAMADYVAAIDQGTTSTRFMVFDHAGKEIGKHQLEHSQIMPRPGWVEHNPVEILDRTSSVVQTAMNRLRLDAGDLV